MAIETYGEAKQVAASLALWNQRATTRSELEKFLDLPNGIPAHDTFARVLGALEPQALQASFLSWVSSISQKLGLDVIHIDGKTTKGSYDREKKLKALHSVSAWSSEHG